jgi:sugar lactone lactonase YvrE/enterochelin esterase-like enzyme
MPRNLFSFARIAVFATTGILFGSIGFLGSEPPGWPDTVVEEHTLVELHAEKHFFEGPTWNPGNSTLYFTAFMEGKSQIRRLDGAGKISPWLDDAHGVNGMYLTSKGTLVGVRGDDKRVVEFDFGETAPSETRVLYHDESLIQPNDICEAPSGMFYFTDPDFKNHGKSSAVYRLSRDGTAHRVTSDVTTPNGLITSLDGKTLYVADSHELYWKAFPILPNGDLAPGKVFLRPGVESKLPPDGMTIDEHGNLYFTGRGGIWAVTPQGRVLGFIPIPEFCSNVTFGGDDGKSLFVTGSGKLYRIKMKVRGAQLQHVGMPAPPLYPLGEDSKRQEGVPRGTVTQHTWESRIFERTVRQYWVYVPQQYDASKPANLVVFQDGHAYVAEEGDFRVPVVLDNLIHKGDLPPTIGLFINPGHLPPPEAVELAGVNWAASNRRLEYDTLGDRYVSFLVQEMLPLIEKEYKISPDPKTRAIGGISSGGICAFTAAWERPDVFGNVISHVGTFVDILGGHVYPTLIRKRQPKPIRVFLQAGRNDLNLRWGDWWLANLQMESALAFAGYDYKFVPGDEGHNGKHGGALLPETLRWIWPADRK